MAVREGRGEKAPSLSHPRHHHPCRHHPIVTFIVSFRRGDEGGRGNAGGPCWLLPKEQRLKILWSRDLSETCHDPLTLLLLAEDGLELLDAVGGGQPGLARQAANTKRSKYFSAQAFLFFL